MWDDECTNVLFKLSTRITNATTFKYQYFSVPFLFDSDASDKGIGAVLSQLSKDQLEHPIAYFSRTLGKHERNYTITRKTLLAAIERIEHFRCYLYGRQFLVCKDYVAIQ